MAILGDYLNLGFFTIHGNWAAIIISGIIGILILKNSLKKRGFGDNKHVDWIFNSIFYGIVT